MGAKKKTHTSSVMNGWVADESGYERTRNPQIISQILEKVKSKGRFITLYHKEYQSGSTVLVDYGKQLVIDKPKNWPQKINSVRIAFRDEAKLWNHFQVPILSTDEKYICTKLPKEIFQLQRRDNFRVEIPHDTLVDFTYQNKKMTALFCENVSVGGMLIRMKGPLLLHGDLISDISISFPRPGKNRAGAACIQIKHAMVVRTFKEQGDKEVWFGIKFLPSIAEEDELHQYIRSRELELIQKGVAG